MRRPDQLIEKDSQLRRDRDYQARQSPGNFVQIPQSGNERRERSHWSNRRLEGRRVSR
jgi:hypothetical protein